MHVATQETQNDRKVNTKLLIILFTYKTILCNVCVCCVGDVYKGS